MSLPKLPFATDKCLIGSRWIAPQTGDTIDLINPSDGSFLAPIAAAAQRTSTPQLPQRATPLTTAGHRAPPPIAGVS